MSLWMQVTGWTLIHFVWQGGLLALATAAGLRLARRRSAHARYVIACVGLTVMLAGPMVTAVLLASPGSALVRDRRSHGTVAGSDVTVSRPATDYISSSTNGTSAVPRIRLDTWLPLVVWGWFGGVMLLSARMAGGCWRVHRLRVASAAGAASSWQSASERLGARLRLDVAFRVVECGFVDAPTVIGWIRPVILLPVVVMTNLSPVQIEALLAHELAHIRRRDYAVNLLQTMVETLLFYHPGVWWVSARVREEREHCCDDVAVEVCGKPAAYAAALAELASWRSREAGLAVGAGSGALLARVRRLLNVPQHDERRSCSGFAIVGLGVMLAAAVAVHTSSSVVVNHAPATADNAAGWEHAPIRNLSASHPSASAQAPPAAAQSAGESRHIRHTDHFEIYHQPDFDLHAERVGLEAERAYEQVSSDLKHNLAFRVPVILFRTTDELGQSVHSGRLAPPHVASFADPVRDRILLAMDHPADQWYGLLTHEVTHVFLFDILPGTATPPWISEGLAEYARGTWDPSDLAAVREAVRANAIPRMSGLRGDGPSSDSRLIYGLGHAAFDFIESRWGSAGVRQFIFWLRQTATRGGNPYEGALQVTRDEFDQAFERYLRERFAGSAGSSLVERFDYRATLRIEGDITAINASVSVGLACLELWVVTEGGIRQRWAVECGDQTEHDAIRVLRPGDRVIVTGPPARRPAAQRMLMQSLVRLSDGFTWRAHSG